MTVQFITPKPKP